MVHAESNTKEKLNVSKEIVETVIIGRQVFLLSDILQMYQFLIRDGDDEFKDDTPRVTHLQKKLTKHFGEKPKMEKINTNQGTLVFLLVFSVAEAIEKQSLSLAVRKIHSRNVALALREDIMGADHNLLLENVTIESLAKGEFLHLIHLNNFFSI